MAMTAPQRAPATIESFSGTLHDPRTITDKLSEAKAHFHLVSPSTSIGRLPEGFEVSLSALLIDSNTDSGDVFDVGGGKLSLSKVALDRIASMMGISWGPSTRLDDGSHPHYYACAVTGEYTGFDSRPVTIQGDKQLDLRHGSAMVEKIRAEAKSAQSFETKLMHQRARIAELAITMARLRGIRSTGLRTSYAKGELAKPFVVARLMATGYSADPVLRRDFAVAQFSAGLAGRSALFGPAAGAPRPLAALTMHAPPPVGTVREDYDDVPPARPSPRPSAPREVAPAAAGAPHSGGGGGRKTGFVVPFGRSKGDDLADVGDGDLAFLQGYYAKALGDPAKSRYRESNQDGLDAVNAEIAFREGGDREPGGEG